MRSRSAWLVVSVFGLGLGLRLLHLDADPYYYEWNGYIVDEGLWVQHARSLALHGVLRGGHAGELHLLLAPLFNLIHFAIFELAGVSIRNARIFTALCGSAIPIVFWSALRRDIARPALMLGLVLLTVQVDLVALGRVAVPEVAVMSVLLVVYVLLTGASGESRRPLAAGVLMFAATALKATAAPMLAIYSVVAWFAPPPPAAANAPDRRWPVVGRFWLGFAVPSLIVGAAVLVWARLGTTDQLPRRLPSLSPFLRLASPYSAVAFLFEDRFGRTVDLWALGVWMSVLAWTSTRKDEIDLRLRRLAVTSAIWFGSYFALMSLGYYFPTRYKVHILLPMAIFVASGVGLLQRIGIQSVLSSFASDATFRRYARLAALSLPTAAFLAPCLAPLAESLGVDSGRLRFKVLCLAAAWAAVGAAIHRWRRRRGAVGFLVVFPLSAAGIGLFASPPAWSLVAVGALAAAALARGAGEWTVQGCARFVYLSAGCYLVSALIAMAPGYLEPHYTIRDASRDLGVRLADSRSIAVYQAEGLFNDNALRYTSFDRHTVESEPDTVVVGFPYRAPEEWLRRNYRLVTTYRFYVSPEFDRWQSVEDAEYYGNSMATVYARTRDRAGTRSSGPAPGDPPR